MEQVQEKRNGTLRDVAERVGLSVSAVSQILNNKPNDFSSAATKERVRQVARELGYRQRFRHKLMRGDTTRTTALLLSLSRLEQEEHIQQLLNTLTQVCNQSGYATYLYRLTCSIEDNIRIVNELSERGTEQFILIGPPVGHCEVTAAIEKFGRNWICYGNAPCLTRTVNPDIAAGAEAVIHHFLQRGIRNFRMLCCEESHERINGLLRCFPGETEAELCHRYVRTFQSPAIGAVDIPGEFDRLGEALVNQLLAEDPGIQGVFCQSDYLATGAMRALFRHGRRIGEDILLAGFNNIHAIRVALFPVISVEHNIAEIVRLLVLHAGSRDPVHYEVPPKLILR